MLSFYIKRSSILTPRSLLVLGESHSKIKLLAFKNSLFPWLRESGSLFSFSSSPLSLLLPLFPFSFPFMAKGIRVSDFYFSSSSLLSPSSHSRSEEHTSELQSQ